MVSESKKAYMKKWRSDNKERIKEVRRAYYIAHREKSIADAKEWTRTHREEDRAKSRAYRLKQGSKERKRAYDREYYRSKEKNNPEWVVKSRLRARLNMAIKTNAKNGSAIRDLGCSIEHFLKHLEQQFQPGMTWENRGEWQIDHIKPLCTFNLLDREQFLQAVNYKNMQPLWAIQNQRKNRYE